MYVLLGEPDNSSAAEHLKWMLAVRKHRQEAVADARDFGPDSIPWDAE